MRFIGLLAAAYVIGAAGSAYSQVLNPGTGGPNEAQPAPAVGAPASWPARKQPIVSYPPLSPQEQMMAQPQPEQPAAPVMQMQYQAPAAAPVIPESIDSEGGGAIPALPLEIMTSSGVVYVSGGIGEEEKEMLKAREHEFNVRVLIASPRGEFVSNVGLRFLDDKGTPLVQINYAGPYVYAKMIPGTYTLETAAFNGEHKMSKFTVGDKGVTKLHVTISE